MGFFEGVAIFERKTAEGEVEGGRQRGIGTREGVSASSLGSENISRL